MVESCAGVEGSDDTDDRRGRLRAVGARAARLGTRTSDVIENPVRQQLGLDLFGRLGDRGPLTEDDAMALAVEAQHKTRRPHSYARGDD